MKNFKLIFAALAIGIAMPVMTPMAAMAASTDEESDCSAYQGRFDFYNSELATYRGIKEQIANLNALLAGNLPGGPNGNPFPKPTGDAYQAALLKLIELENKLKEIYTPEWLASTRQAQSDALIALNKCEKLHGITHSKPPVVANPKPTGPHNSGGFACYNGAGGWEYYMPIGSHGKPVWVCQVCAAKPGANETACNPPPPNQIKPVKPPVGPTPDYICGKNNTVTQCTGPIVGPLLPGKPRPVATSTQPGSTMYCPIVDGVQVEVGGACPNLPKPGAINVKPIINRP